MTKRRHSTLTKLFVLNVRALLKQQVNGDLPVNYYLKFFYTIFCIGQNNILLRLLSC